MGGIVPYLFELEFMELTNSRNCISLIRGVFARSDGEGLWAGATKQSRVHMGMLDKKCYFYNCLIVNLLSQKPLSILYPSLSSSEGAVRLFLYPFFIPRQSEIGLLSRPGFIFKLTILTAVYYKTQGPKLIINHLFFHHFGHFAEFVLLVA